MPKHHAQGLEQTQGLDFPGRRSQARAFYFLAVFLHLSPALGAEQGELEQNISRNPFQPSFPGFLQWGFFSVHLDRNWKASFENQTLFSSALRLQPWRKMVFERGDLLSQKNK